MNPTAGKFIIGIITAVGVFLAGRFYQDSRNGYTLKVVGKKEYTSQFGPVTWSESFETIGFVFLDTSTTMIELQGRTLFKAKRFFQESYPVAQDMKIDGDTITWKDGEFSYKLLIQKTEEKKTPNKAPQTTIMPVTDAAAQPPRQP